MIDISHVAVGHPRFRLRHLTEVTEWASSQIWNARSAMALATSPRNPTLGLRAGLKYITGELEKLANGSRPSRKKGRTITTDGR